jgi:hypothetical protein
VPCPHTGRRRPGEQLRQAVGTPCPTLN